MNDLKALAAAQLFFSDEQLAERYGVSRSTIWRWLKNGAFPEPVKLSAGCTRWSMEGVHEWERQKAEAA